MNNKFLVQIFLIDYLDTCFCVSKILFFSKKKTISYYMEKIISLTEFPNVSLLFGNYNANIKLMRDSFNVKIVARDNLKVSGEDKDVERTILAIEQINKKIVDKGTISSNEVAEIIQNNSDKTNFDKSSFEENEKDFAIDEGKKAGVRNQPLVKPRTPGQNL